MSSIANYFTDTPTSDGRCELGNIVIDNDYHLQCCMSDLFAPPVAVTKVADLAKTSSYGSTKAVASYRSLDLLQGQTSALIHHDQQVYTLRLTAQNKLILTK